MRQVEEPSHMCVPVASCDRTLVTEKILLISEEKLRQLVTEHGPNGQGADFTHRLWARSLRNDAPETGT